MTRLNDNPEQSVAWVCSIADNLEKTDDVLINDRVVSLRVIKTERKEGVGAEYPFLQVWLEGNGTTYCLKYSHKREYHPKIYSASEWREETNAKGETEVKMNTGTGEDVLYIETDNDGETALLSDKSASEFIGADDTLSTTLPDSPENAVQIKSEDTTLGECPDCGGSVKEDGEQAVCTDCGLWCWMAQWEDFEQQTSE